MTGLVRSSFEDGSVYAWGAGDSGLLGNGDPDVTEQLRAAQVLGVDGSGTLANVVSMSGGRVHTLALREDGSIVAWGNNFGGRLGDGSDVNSDVPVVVEAIDDAVAVAAGEEHSFAIRSDGSLWRWGSGALTPARVQGISLLTEVVSAQTDATHLVR